MIAFSYSHSGVQILCRAFLWRSLSWFKMTSFSFFFSFPSLLPIFFSFICLNPNPQRWNRAVGASTASRLQLRRRRGLAIFILTWYCRLLAISSSKIDGNSKPILVLHSLNHIGLSNNKMTDFSPNHPSKQTFKVKQQGFFLCVCVSVCFREEGKEKCQSFCRNQRKKSSLSPQTNVEF